MPAVNSLLKPAGYVMPVTVTNALPLFVMLMIFDAV